MPEPSLQTFLNALDVSKAILNNIIPNAEEESIVLAAKQGIEEVKNVVDVYIKKKNDELTYHKHPPGTFD